MNKLSHRMIIIAASTFVFMGVLAFAFSPAHAYTGGTGMVYQVTPFPEDPMATTIPNTGGNVVDPVGLSWVIWAILGISVLALLIALATRSTSRRDL